MTQNYSLYRRKEQSNQSKSQHVKTLRKGNRSAPYLNKNKGNAKRGYVPIGNKGTTRIRQNSQLKRPDHDTVGITMHLGLVVVRDGVDGLSDLAGVIGGDAQYERISCHD